MKELILTELTALPGPLAMDLRKREGKREREGEGKVKGNG